MTRIRLFHLASIGALVLAPALANAQQEYGGQQYGGAPVGEDLEEPEPYTPPPATTTVPPEEEMDVGAREEPAPTPSPAIAEEPGMMEEEEEEPSRLLMPFGMSISAGGGVTDFVDDDIQGLTGTGGAWEARFAAGTRSWVGVEGAYVGSAQEIDALGLDTDAALLGSGLEAVVRLNLGTYNIQPYIAGGLGWTHYEVINEDFNTSSVNPDDDVLTVPLSAGLSTYIGKSGFLIDGRFTYRPTFNEDLLAPGTGNETEEDLDNWAATIKLGYEF